jgi:protein-S-isoprenylcysteine O-methyltransferase Ste14
MLRVRPARGTRVALSGRESVGGSAPRAVRGALRALERGAARLVVGLGVALALLPAWAWACPSCVQRAPESSVRSALLVGTMLLVPFGVVALGMWAARRAERGDAQRSP